MGELLKWMAGRVDRVLHASSCAIYGSGSNGRPQDELSKVNPDTGYALSKYAQEQLLSAYCLPRGIPLSLLRLGYVYGPDVPLDRAVMQFIDMVQKGRPVTLKNGWSCGLPLIHQQDIARIVPQLLLDSAGVYNLASHDHISLAHYVNEVMRIVGTKTEVTCSQEKGLGNSNHFPCNALLEQHGLLPRVALEEGIESMIKAKAESNDEPE